MIMPPALVMENWVIVLRWKICGVEFAGVSSMGLFMNLVSEREHFWTMALSSGKVSQ
jgi:hypothetical protein